MQSEHSRAKLGPIGALRAHWPEYLIEGWALGMFMVSAGFAVVFLEYPDFPLRRAIADADLRRALIGIAMGLTAMALIYSPWGKRSGAHMNPAVTLAFLRLGDLRPWDAMYYILAQVLGGTAGVLLVLLFLGEFFSAPEVRYVVTVPASGGLIAAFAAEFAMSFFLFLAILLVSGSAKLNRFTGVVAGVLVASYIAVEAPLSGMSINPARTIASALPSGIWTGWWLYMTAPPVGMLAAAELHLLLKRRREIAHGKLVWCDRQPCIHCDYEPRIIVLPTDADEPSPQTEERP
jgi:aquaporin Z